MRIITYSTKINRENNLTELVKEKAYNYKTENKHLDCAEKIASMICDLFELHTAQRNMSIFYHQIQNAGFLAYLKWGMEQLMPVFYIQGRI